MKTKLCYTYIYNKMFWKSLVYYSFILFFHSSSLFMRNASIIGVPFPLLRFTISLLKYPSEIQLSVIDSPEAALVTF